MFKLENIEEPSWLWSHCSWIYNYLCNQCISRCELDCRSGEVYSIQHYAIMDNVCLWLGTGQFLPPIKLTATM